MLRSLIAALPIMSALFASSLAEDLRTVTRSCRIERFDEAYANCVDLIADTRELAMDDAIAKTLAGLQAATNPELRALQAQYESSQEAWRQAVAFGCGQAFLDAPRSGADCRIQAVIAREDQLALSLERLAYDLGGPETFDIPVPNEVEILLPLPPGVNGPRRRVRVPLLVPVLP